MAGRCWLVDSNRIATKIKSASGSCDPERVTWKSNPTRACPNCQNIIDNSDVAHEWPGLPRGVKFDPSDQEIMWHLLAKVGVENIKSHPFIDEFIPTVNKDDGICYTHPQKLPGVKQDGSVSHFFHRAINAYNSGTRKRRKIQGDNVGDVRWHKTGRTKPVILDGAQRGCKKILVLYLNPVKGGKQEKTNWVMHQYHLGTGEDEKDGEYVISKIFHQQQQVKVAESVDHAMITRVDPVTPKSVTPDPPRSESWCSEFNPGHDCTTFVDTAVVHNNTVHDEYEVQPQFEEIDHNSIPISENHTDPLLDNKVEEEPKWWDGESQFLLDSQQLAEGLSLCDDLLQSQSPNRDGNRNKNKNERILEGKPCLSDYAQLGPEYLKKDIEACQSLVLDPANIDLDKPPEFQLSQLDFGSQESFTAWGGSKVL